MAITKTKLSKIKPGEWLTNSDTRGSGQLMAYGMKSGGATFYFRYTLPKDESGKAKRDSYPLGPHDGAGTAGITLEQAEDRANELSRRYRAGERDLRSILKAEKEAAEQAAADAAAAEAKALAEAEERARVTLSTLLNAYVAQLRKDGKASAREVETAFARHIERDHPGLWKKPLVDVDDEDLFKIVTTVTDEGKMRAAAKLRSYLHAAYVAAIRARRSASAIPALRSLNWRHNPVAELAPIAKTKHDEYGSQGRKLSLAELAAYWRRIEQMDDAGGALLRFHILTGAQRIVQLGRLTEQNFDRDAKTITIMDVKGRRTGARKHVLPLLPEALSAMHAMREPVVGNYLFTVSNGLTGATNSIVSDRLEAVVTAMRDAGELEGGKGFTVGALRRTVETRLAAEDVSKYHRAQLQSHGIGGVQDEHYDGHDYLDAKRNALLVLRNLLRGKPGKRRAGNVRSLRETA
ncbi:MAG TPA: hypothetical protein VFG49_01630 [Dyella sp.]|uniref:hypothetical protein n=1 Tax=Dyella sp. TaxID=1869338 RepID=UPI002D799A9C|nr:hypothetical protein [Dyella sp.]HET6552212.1 hypothetical protein [Dyella sp.]